MVLGGRLLAGRYRLDEPIGTGWFSEVWRATDTALSRPVAVKLLHPAYAQQPEALARFRAGALHAAALWHENITHIYDYDEPTEGPQPYLVMELVDGLSLAGVLAGGPLDAARTMDVVAQAAAGLQAAHAKGLVHRDIRPGNLLLAASGTVKITDWGIAQAIGSTPGTVTGTVTGTAEYLAPERTAGAQAVPASDLYALGVVAYECLAGAPPFVGEPPDVGCAHRDHAVPPLPGSVPADVSALVLQLVAKDPARRPGSAAEVAQRAGRLREDLRDDFIAGPGRMPYPTAAPAAVPPPPAIASAGAAAAPGGKVRLRPGPRPVRGRGLDGVVAGQSRSSPSPRSPGSSPWCWPSPWVPRSAGIRPARYRLRRRGTRPAGPWRPRPPARRPLPARAARPAAPAPATRAWCRWLPVTTELSPPPAAAAKRPAGTGTAKTPATGTATATATGTATGTATATATGTATGTRRSSAS